MSLALPHAAALPRCICLCVALVSISFGMSSAVQAQERAERGVGLRVVPFTLDAEESVSGDAVPLAGERALAETFETAVFPPTGWTRFENRGDDTPQWVLAAFNGNQFAYSRYGDLGAGVVEDWLVTPLLAVTAAEQTLTFDMAQQFDALWGSTFSVAVSTASPDQPGDFDVIASWNEEQGPGGQPAPPIYTDGFATYTIDLSAFVGQNVYIAFIHDNDYGDSFLLDNVAGPSAFVPSAPPACASGFSPGDGSTNASAETLILSWQPPASGGQAAGYRVSLGTDPGATNIADNVDIGNSTSVEVQNADPGTTYYYRVEPYNAAGPATGCATIAFTTANPRAVFPYTEDFDDADVCGLPSRWSLEGNPVSGESWQFQRSMEYGASEDHTTGAGCFAAVDDSSPDDAPVYLLSPYFDFGALTAPRLSFWVQNRQGRAFDYSELFVDVTTDGGGSYATAVGQATGRYRDWTEIVVDLSDFAGEPNVRLRFRAVEVSGGFLPYLSDLSMDDVFVGEDPDGAAVFAISPGSGGAYDFGTVAPCESRERVFTIANDGPRRSTLTVSALNLSGDAAFSIVDVSPALPVDLDEDESMAFHVRFDPTDAGAKVATMDIDYSLDGDPTQTFALELNGEGDALGPSEGAGDGYVWRNSSACSDGVVSVESIAFGPAAGDMEITAWDTGTPNDGFTAIDLAPTIGSFRFYAEDYGTLYVSTNGYVFFDFGATIPGPPFPATTEFETAYIAALGDDLDLGAGGAVYYRGRDIDSSGGDDELVLTFFRVPRFNVPGDFATFQVILRPSDAPGGNGTIKLQYLVGPSPDDGQPLSQGFDDANSFNDDARVGITGDQGFASVLYRDNGTGGVLYGPSSLAVEFAPRVERIEGADAAGFGWRMLSAPAAGMTVADLAEQNLVQGLSDEYPVDAEGNPAVPNIYTAYSSASGYQRPSGLAAPLTPGKGFIWFLFDIDYDPEADASVFTGDSQSYPLPAPIVAAGDPQAGDVTAPLTSAPDENGAIFELLGNPFAATLDISDIASWTAGSLASAVGQVWDPGAGTYVTTSDLGDTLPVWQGAFFENDTATEITYPIAAAPARSTPTAARDDGGLSDPVRRVRFELSGTAADSGTPTHDRALVLEFSGDGTDDWDMRDATKLSPLTSVYATAAFEGDRNGVHRLKAQESRSAVPAPFEVPLHVETSGVTGELVLSWTLDAFPEDWKFLLQDHASGERIDLGHQDTYEFRLIGDTRSSAHSEYEWHQDDLARVLQPVPMQRGAETRFTLFVVPGLATATDPQNSVPERLSLDGAYPNPFAGRTTVRYALPVDTRVVLAVYDLLGRRVAVLADGFARAGYHEATWDAAGLPSGVYLFRLETAGQRLLRKVTLLR